MRTLALGDVHGGRKALDRVLEAARPGPDDVLIALGDYVDRGDDSAGVLDRLIEWESRCHLVPLLGNHDRMMIQARRDPTDRDIWLRMGGDRALDSYPGGRLEDVPQAHWDFLDRCRLWYETNRFLFVHAHVDPALPMDRQEEKDLLWRHVSLARPHVSGKPVICGHSSQKSGRPLNLGHTLCIDTAAGHGLWLTCLDVEMGHCWQADEAGQTRTLQLAWPGP